MLRPPAPSLRQPGPIRQDLDSRDGLTGDRGVLLPMILTDDRHIAFADSRELAEGHDGELRSKQRLCQNPARRIAGLQGLRGRQGLRLSRHHAAGAGPHAGDPEGAGAQHSRYRAGRPRPSHQDDADDCARGSERRLPRTASPFSNSTSRPADRWCFTCMSTSFRAKSAWRSSRRRASRKSRRCLPITRTSSPPRSRARDIPQSEREN